MRAGPSSETLAGASRWQVSVSSWKGPTLLAAEIPITSGRFSAKVGVAEGAGVPERVTFTVPELADGRSWVPTFPTHPLAEKGQFLEVDMHVTSAVTGITVTSRMGRFQIQKWTHDDVEGVVTVEAVGILQRVLDARLRVPRVPRATGTLKSEMRRLAVSGIPVEFDPLLVDRACPQSFEWDEDRLDAMYEIADAWPARIRVDELGTLRVLPPLPEVPTPLLTLTDGERGTLISAPREGSRDGIYNVVVARSSATDTPGRAPLQGVAEVQYGEMAPAMYGEVVMFWSSPLATTSGRLAASAQKILSDKVRGATVQNVTCVPDPRLELDDPVTLVRDGLPTVGYIIGFDLPLTVEDGAMSLVVGLGT